MPGVVDPVAGRVGGVAGAGLGLLEHWLVEVAPSQVPSWGPKEVGVLVREVRGLVSLAASLQRDSSTGGGGGPVPVPVGAGGVKPGTRPVLAGVETGPSGALIGNLEEALAAYRAQAIPADVVEGDDV